MKITIKGTNIELNEEIKDFIIEKIESLDKFMTGILEATVEVGKISHHHRKGNVFRAEANLRVPGDLLRAEAKAEDINIAINKIKDELQRKIKTYKNSQNAKQKRGRRVLKREIHLDPIAKYNREKKKGGRELDEGSLQ